MTELEDETEIRFKIKIDPEVTRVVKFMKKANPTELSKSFNVVKEKMSLVGSKPNFSRKFIKFIQCKEIKSLKQGRT